MTIDTQSTLVRLVSLIGRCGQMYFDRELSPINIRSGQIRILRALDIRDGINQEHIRLLSHLDKATIAKTIKPLVREGYIQRTKNPDDKRAYQISLTDKGRQIMPMLKQTIRSWTDILTTGFTDDEKRTFNDLITRMSENASNHLFDQGSARKRGATK
jgi:DNA-binding MarR family transcriptional regulator